MLRVAPLALLLALTIARISSAQDVLPVLVDTDMTVGAGATVTAAIGAAVARAEDAFVPARLFAERGITRRAVNITYRLFKLAYFDAPQEQWLMVANHELMGHGARLRERFDGPIGYTIDAPAPYGPGGGSTFFGFDREPSARELLAISAAGMEADAVAARVMADAAFRRGRMRPRDALRYLTFELDTLNYVLNTGDEPEEPGHDVSDFLQTYNELAALTGAEAVAARTLRREALLSLANPMVAFAAYGIGRHLWNGATDVRVPGLSIAGVRYLPLVRYQLAPYGTEWALMNHLGGAFWPTRVEVRVGRSPGGSPWGIGVGRRGLAGWRSWRVDLEAEVWRQPPIRRAGPDADESRLRVGAEIRGRLERAIAPVWFTASRATLIVDIGAKSAGFVPGEPLGGGVVARVGIGVPFGP
jgi:hypothetical protein